jgi:hypothetical protein
MIDAPALPPRVMPALRPRVMPAKAGIHDFLCCDKDKSWMPTGACPRAALRADPGVGMTMGGAVEPPTSLAYDFAQIMWQPLA